MSDSSVTHQTPPSGGVHLLLVGCGKMGGTLLDRWKQSPSIACFDVIAPNPPSKNESNIRWHRNLESLPASYAPDIIVLAVKPQKLDELLPKYHTRFAGSTPLYISVAAGRTLAFYQSHLGSHAHVVRVMPNTPALVGEGMSVLCAASTLPAAARKVAGDLMKAVGKIEWLEEESLMDAVTALSGCGPAYVFLFLESLIRGAVQAGLPEPLAKTLTLQTVSGSLALAAHSAKSFGQLRADVASPGGSTEAGLKVLTADNGFIKRVEEAINAAKNRAKELSNTNG